MLRLLCVLIAGCVAVSNASAQEVLQWKFQNGETLKFNVEQTMKTNMTMAGNAVKTSMSQIMDMSWNVKNVAADGRAVVAQQIDRVQLKMQGGPFGEGTLFDSNDNRVPSNPMVKAMSDVFRKLIGQSFQVTMNSTGKVENVVVPDELLKSLTQTGAGVNNMLNEDTLQQMMGQSSVELPASGVTVGQSWETKQNVQLPVGNMAVTSRMTYTGKDSQTGLAKIAMKPMVTVEPNKDSPIQLKLTRSDGDGLILFDQKTGRIQQSDLTLNLEMQIQQFGQTITQNIEQSTVMKLVR